MRTHPINPAENEFILFIATHPRLHPLCWEQIANAQLLRDALLSSLQTYFPSETKVCQLTARRKNQSFWQVAAELTGRGWFETVSVQNGFTEVHILPQSSFDLSGGSLSDEAKGIHIPGEVYDYLLMSGTS